MKPGIRLSVFSILLIVSFFVVPVVSAHPLGNFTINHFNGIHVAADKVSVDYVLDMAEIPAFQEISLLDKGPDGKADPAALTAYADRQCKSIAAQLVLADNGVAAALAPIHSDVTLPTGAAGLSTLRLTCTFQNTSIHIQSNDRIDFTDTSFSDRIGWREIVVYADGISLQGTFATSSISNELTSYPQDMLTSPLDVRQVNLKVGLAGDSAQNGTAGKAVSQNTAAWSAGARSDGFTQLITLQDMTPASIMVALLLAFLWGGLHSFTPGHGKTIVGAYLVGNRGTALHAVYLGLMTTLTHTAGVFLLGMLTLFASRYILPDQLFPWISILSGVLVVVIGFSLFFSRFRSTQAWKNVVNKIKKPVNQVITFPEGARSDFPIQFSSITAIGLNPMVGHEAIMATRHHHVDGSVHSHEAGGHDHRDGSVHIHDGGRHSHDANEPGGHTHLPPGADGTKVSMRSLLILGISGGLLPCPSALVVMLGAIALNRIGFGIILVLAFSFGLASVLTGIGLIMVYSRRFFDRIPVHSRFMELIPAGSALFIMIIGLGITLQALAQLGWIRL